MTVIVEREVLVLSDDGAIRDEIGAAVARHPGAHAVYAADVPRPAPSGIVVVDDEGRPDAIDLVRRLTAPGGDASIVYLAANHNTALEAEVRRAGVSFYTVKAARDGDLTRVLEVLLARATG